MKTVLVLLLVAGLLAPGQAFADPGNVNSDHSQHSNNGNTNGAGNGNANGADKGNGNSNGALGGGSVSITVPDAGSTPTSSTTDQNNALEAVKSGKAMPLSDIVARAEAKWGGRVIDAKLVQAKGVLVYRLTMLSDAGLSRRVYYEALSGRPVGLR